ncbi:MAG: PKD domain-containing protein, partial [Thermodesulfobacteriota bacterium]
MKQCVTFVLLGAGCLLLGCERTTPTSDLPSPPDPSFATTTVASGTTTLDFDPPSAPFNGFMDPNHFESLGVLFSTEGGNWPYIRSFNMVSVFNDPNAHASSPPSAIAGGSPGYEWNDVFATFVDPSSGAPRTVTFVEVVACSGPGGDPLSSNVALLAFDPDGTLVAADYADDNVPYQILSVEAPAIASVQMVAGSWLDVYDDFTFTTIEGNHPPVAHLNGPYVVDEGSPITFDGSGSTDPDDNIVAYEWDLDHDGEYDDASGVTATWTYADNGTYPVGLRVTDEFGESDVGEGEVTVANVAPSVGPITTVAAPVAVGEVIAASTSFTDPGLDTWTATMAWGDGPPKPAALVGKSFWGDHAYAEPGVYTLTFSVSDDDGGVGNAVYEYVVVYDPSAGFVTGGGWFNSPTDAYSADPSLRGKATFGFVSRYMKGATVPTGNTEFQFKAGNLNFHSTSYDWLVVTGSDYARFKGSGTINGVGDYMFMIWAGDGVPDTVRIKIWTEDEFGEETVVYDNGFKQAIGGGSIVVH